MKRFRAIRVSYTHTMGNLQSWAIGRLESLQPVSAQSNPKGFDLP